ncbi:DUF2218 domain-containing protein [Nocardia uniformis]|uniref:DUF2218 domain-containing protein n=1 Tax=Nocardia uniformis TaxID=53432 RepID=A0A849CB49_9NOCA|nr:DUF2218 domain-containing protein [Nocardia uniformis]NNH76073.1 DUF2218 domain-containing protein [Nocardia uniformis]
MPTAEAHVLADNPSRYLTQLCKHASSMGRATHHGPRIHLGAKLDSGELRVHAEWTDTHGTVAIEPWGECKLTADAKTLTLRVSASDETNLRRIEELITRDLERFGRLERLTVEWRQDESPAATPETGATR